MSSAMIYLPLHRTRPVAVTSPTPGFGFRAASARGGAASQELARNVDLDLARARRQAVVLAGLALAADLSRLQALADGMVLRGAAAVARDWAERETPARGKALMIDCGLDLPARSLGQACRRAQISLGAGWEQAQPSDEADCQLAAAQATGLALMTALLAGKHLGRLTWNQDLDITEIIAVSMWDCFAHLRVRPAAGADPIATSSSPGGSGAA